MQLDFLNDPRTIQQVDPTPLEHAIKRVLAKPPQWQVQAYLSRLARTSGEMQRSGALSMNEQDAEILAKWPTC